MGAVLVAMCAAGCAEEPTTAVVTGAPDGTSISEPDDTPTFDPTDASAPQPAGTPSSAPSSTLTTKPAGTPTSSTAGAPTTAPSGAPTPLPADSSASESPSPGKEELTSPELGTHLDDLASRLEAGGRSEEEIAAAAPLSRGDSVGIAIHVNGNVDGVLALLADNDVSPRHVGSDFVEAFVPVRLLRQVGRVDAVLFVEPIVPPEPETGFTGSSQKE